MASAVLVNYHYKASENGTLTMIGLSTGQKTQKEDRWQCCLEVPAAASHDVKDLTMTAWAWSGFYRQKLIASCSKGEKHCTWQVSRTLAVLCHNSQNIKK